MNEAPAHLFAANDGPRAELARLCRRICVTREALPPDIRAPLDNELADALASVRLAHGPETVNGDDLLDLFRTEQNRVADAAILAELVAPRLAQFIQSQIAAASPAKSSDEPRANPPPRPPSSFPPQSSSPAGPPDIADLLDGMLAQDRAEDRTRRPGSRK